MKHAFVDVSTDPAVILQAQQFRSNKMAPYVKKVPARLADLGKLYEERNALYKDNYKRFGIILVGLFPDGLTLHSSEEFNRFALFVQIMHKQTRYANNIKTGGHPDSLDDTTVYAQMLAEVDDEYRAQNPTKESPNQDERTFPIQTRADRADTAQDVADRTMREGTQNKIQDGKSRSTPFVGEVSYKRE